VFPFTRLSRRNVVCQLFVLESTLFVDYKSDIAHDNTKRIFFPLASFLSVLQRKTVVVPQLTVRSMPVSRDGFRERGALGYLNFCGPTQVWLIWPFVGKA